MEESDKDGFKISQLQLIREGENKDITGEMMGG